MHRYRAGASASRRRRPGGRGVPGRVSQRERYDLTGGAPGPVAIRIATNLTGAHRRKEARYYRDLARTDARSAWHGDEDRSADRPTAEAARSALAAALAPAARRYTRAAFCSYRPGRPLYVQNRTICAWLQSGFPFRPGAPTRRYSAFLTWSAWLRHSLACVVARPALAGRPSGQDRRTSHFRRWQAPSVPAIDSTAQSHGVGG